MNSISFEERTGPALEFPQINCDRPLARRFEGKPILENMNHTFAAAFIGVPGSGKTSLVEAFFKTEEYFYGVFHRIFQIIPPSSAKSVDDSVFQLIPENQKFPKLTLDVLDQVWQTALSMRNRDPPLWTCLIMDDVQSQFKKPEIEQKMKEMLANRRHAGLSIILLAQNYKQIPKDVRKLFTDLFIFDISMAEWDEVYEEHAKFYKKQWQEVLRNYSRRIREEREKERAKKPHEKLFLYLNFKYRELYFGMNMKVNVDENWAPEISATTIRKRKRKDEEDEVTAKAAKTV